MLSRKNSRLMSLRPDAQGIEKLKEYMSKKGLWHEFVTSQKFNLIMKENITKFRKNDQMINSNNDDKYWPLSTQDWVRDWKGRPWC